MNGFSRVIKNQMLHTLHESNKVVVLYGARQVGKTTLVKKILQKCQSEGYFNCEEMFVREILESQSSDKMYRFFAEYPVIVLDEAQTVPNIGRSLKVLFDAHPEMKVIVTGSSAFELANKVNEPLTGRKREFFLSGLSFQEIADKLGLSKAVERTDERLVYGAYPEVVTANSLNEKQQILHSLTSSYLYKDVLNYQNIRNPELLSKILKALALQVGNEVSYNEIAILLQVDRKTVISYINLLEQAFVIFKLQPYFSNHRNELKKKPKIYFHDNGVINALTGNFLDISSRNDIGALWENYLVSERHKFNVYNMRYRNSYFWRSHSKQEIDLIEEYDGKLRPYEFKYTKNKPSLGSRAFVEAYNSKSVRVINKDNFYEWLK